MLFSKDEFESRLGSTVDSDVYDTIHDYVSALIVLEGGGPYTGLSETELSVLRGIGISVALREYENPQRHASETSGPFSFSGAIQSLFTDDELRLLHRCFGIPGYSGAYTVALSTPADTAYPYVGT